jgi:hypothetical protein
VVNFTSLGRKLDGVQSQAGYGGEKTESNNWFYWESNQASHAHTHTHTLKDLKESHGVIPRTNCQGVGKKGKVVPVLMTYGGNRSIASPFLTSALDGGQWSASRPGRFNHGKVLHWTGVWVGPRASLNAVEQRKIACPCR